MLSDPKFWIAVCFVAFFAAFGKKILRFATQAMDKRSRRIAVELSEAESLRLEAEKTLALYQRKYHESMKEAEGIIARARDTAEQMLAQAEVELNAAMQRRTHQAMDRIAEEEKRAVAEVRDHVVDITIAAARSIVEEQLHQASGDDMVRYVVADLERKVH